MKVALVVYGSIDTVSGGYLYDRRLVDHLRSCGDRVEIVSIPSGTYLTHLLDNFTFRLPSEVDVIIEDELVHPSVIRANRRKPRGVPVVSLVHNLHSSEWRAAWQNALFRSVEKSHLESVDGFIFNSVVTRDSVLALVDSERPYVLAPPGGDRLGSVSPEAVRLRLAHPGPLRLLFLATVAPLKGLHVLLDALSGVRGDWTLDVAGSLAVDHEYARAMQVRAAGLRSPTRFHGVLDEAPLTALLRSTDLVVIPSYWEGFGIAYLEGMAFGIPAIGTAAGAIPHMLQQGVNGYMIPPGDAAELREIITQLAYDRQLLQRLSLNALSYFTSRPTWGESGEIVRGFLVDLLQQRGSADFQQQGQA
jgi:glycosyltransferase involved in cell wall biosynthesis